MTWMHTKKKGFMEIRTPYMSFLMIILNYLEGIVFLGANLVVWRRSPSELFWGRKRIGPDAQYSGDQFALQCERLVYTGLAKCWMLNSTMSFDIIIIHPMHCFSGVSYCIANLTVFHQNHCNSHDIDPKCCSLNFIYNKPIQVASRQQRKIQIRERRQLKMAYPVCKLQLFISLDKSSLSTPIWWALQRSSSSSCTLTITPCALSDPIALHKPLPDSLHSCSFTQRNTHGKLFAYFSFVINFHSLLKTLNNTLWVSPGICKDFKSRAFLEFTC